MPYAKFENPYNMSLELVILDSFPNFCISRPYSITVGDALIEFFFFFFKQ